jgi:NAD(P)H-nitrite reductase large subunit
LDRFDLEKNSSSLDSLSQGDAPIVIIGSGLAGIQCARELLLHQENLAVTVYAKELCNVFQNISLSSWIPGYESKEDTAQVQFHHHCSVLEIDVKQRWLFDSTGRYQPYSILIIATGAYQQFSI